MDETERFAALVARREPEIPLDEAALLVAAHAYPGLAIERWTARLDELALAVAPGDADALAHHLFVEVGLAGNTDDYTDPRNSFLNDVLERRLGIPITLSVVMMEVGRRCGVAMVGVGMPGHFLVRLGEVAPAEPAPFFDPFGRGRRLGETGCREQFALVQGAGAPFAPSYLEPVGSRAILARMLANLDHSFATREPAAAVWTLRLRLRLPGIAPAERRELAMRLGSLGAFDEAAAELDGLVPLLPEADAGRAERDARALRARAN
jgi:regulator of sirC expression with transglutaminase-like and TPR domain